MIAMWSVGRVFASKIWWCMNERTGRFFARFSNAMITVWRRVDDEAFVRTIEGYVVTRGFT